MKQASPQKGSRALRKPWIHFDASIGLVVLTIITYCALARLIDNLYPFSTFPMYSHTERSASRIVVRDAQGVEHEVEDYHHWHCPEPLDLSPKSCGNLKPFTWIKYLNQDFIDYISSHSTTRHEGDPVTIMRKIWYFIDGQTEVAYCPLQDCTAQLVR